MISDKELEWQRYSDRAKSLLGNDSLPDISGSESLPIVLQAPYQCYESYIKKYSPDQGGVILELGAGTGAFTGALLSTGALVFATDISEDSLNVIKKTMKDSTSLQVKVADMEELPFEDGSFDVVASAGSLSYGDNKIVMDEIYRVLKKGGFFICVDSLNHNPIYKLNRWVHFIKRNRTVSTLKRMPTVLLLAAYGHKFGTFRVRYFGALIWLFPVMKKILPESVVINMFNRFDVFFRIKKSAFKFVMLVRKDN